jgi:hypothetical protein
MKNTVDNCGRLFPLFTLALLLAVPGGIQAQPPDLTTVDLSALDTTYNYNLGPTGMRGWMLSDSHTALGTITAGSWQILVVGVGSGTPAAGIMAN